MSREEFSKTNFRLDDNNISCPINIKYRKKLIHYKRWYMMLSILSAWHRQIRKKWNSIFVNCRSAITVQCGVLREHNGLTKLRLTWRGRRKVAKLQIVESSDAPTHFLYASFWCYAPLHSKWVCATRRVTAS